LEQAKAMVQARMRMRAARGVAAKSAPAETPWPGTVGAERVRLARQQRLEDDRRIREYEALMAIMKQRGVKAARPVEQKSKRRAGKPPALAAQEQVNQPLQILAEGDSWFDYPVPFFGGGIIPRLQSLLGVPILNLAKAGDEVRYSWASNNARASPSGSRTAALPEGRGTCSCSPEAATTSSTIRWRCGSRNTIRTSPRPSCCTSRGSSRPWLWCARGTKT
jgi:hypothetical protein